MARRTGSLEILSTPSNGRSRSSASIIAPVTDSAQMNSIVMTVEFRGAIRPMQRTGKKFFIYPDASRNQVFVGGPKEYEAYVQLHPENRVADAQKEARDASAYRAKQSEAMQKATARDLSDPWLGVTWADLIY